MSALRTFPPNTAIAAYIGRICKHPTTKLRIRRLARGRHSRVRRPRVKIANIANLDARKMATLAMFVAHHRLHTSAAVNRCHTGLLFRPARAVWDVKDVETPIRRRAILR